MQRCMKQMVHVSTETSMQMEFVQVKNKLFIHASEVH